MCAVFGKLSVVGLAVAAVMLLGLSPALADTITFEPPTYVGPPNYSQGNVYGQDGWYDGPVPGDPAGDAYLTPAGPGGFDTVLAGNQSLALYNMGTYGTIAQRFPTAGTVWADGAKLDTLMTIGTNGGAGPTPTMGMASISLVSEQPQWTPAAIEAYLGASPHFELYGQTSVVSSVPVLIDKMYKLEMALDFTNQQFEGFVTNLTDGGLRTSLGTVNFAAYTSHPVDPSLLNSQGGVGLRGNIKDGYKTVLFDNVVMGSPVPEPSSLVLFALAGVGMVAYGWRKRR
jgi:hypothetical protein